VPPDAVTQGLSQLDAFFVAYQEHAGIPMQIGVETELRGHLARDDLDRMMELVTSWWPPLAQRLHRRVFGLAWQGESQVHRMVVESSDPSEIAAWRNRPIDPFVEPPFQLLSIPRPGGTTLVMRAHHAVADGESAYFLATEALLALAAIHGGSVPPSPAITARRSLGKLMRARNLQAMWRSARRLRTEAPAGRSARLWVRGITPGETATVARTLVCEEFGAFRARAATAQTSAPWLCAAAWVRAMHRWNSAHGAGAPSLISLEVPVSLRRTRDRGSVVGNYISPLILLGDAVQPLELVARSLRQQMVNAVHDGRHLALPVLTSPARYLPWGLFRRVSVHTSATGFATSHFAWLSQRRDLVGQIAERSRGALEACHPAIYTPVCLHMGAALAAVAWRDRLQLFITYRVTALRRSDAETLGDLVVAELARSITRRETQLA
jgi:hypothetical protein